MPRAYRVETVEEFRATFWAKVEIVPGAACWPFLGARDPATGYGRVRVPDWFFGKRCVLLAHRLAWILCHGFIPADLWALHECDGGADACARPDHLFLGTHQDNVDDMVRKGRNAHGERHPQAKLLDEQVRRVRALIGAGEPQQAVADALGISQSSVSLIARGKIWRHVQETECPRPQP